MTTNRSEAGNRVALRQRYERWSAPANLDRLNDVVIAGGVALLLAVGFAVSYTTLLDLAVTVGNYPVWLAPAVPLSFDLGIVVLSLKVVRAAREGRTAPVLRLLVVALSVATVVANASAADNIAGAVLHAVPPAMFVVCFESLIASTRRHALERLGLVPPKLPRVRGVRWVLSPIATFKLWRKAVLARSLFEQDTAAPKRAEAPAPKHTADPTPTPPSLRVVASPKRQPVAGSSPKRADFDTLLAATREISKRLPDGGVLSQRSLMSALKADPYRYACGAQRALELLAALNAEPAQEA